MGCSIESPLRQSIRSLLKIWSQDLSTLLVGWHEGRSQILREQFFSSTHIHTRRTMKSQHEISRPDGASCKKYSDAEEVETTKDTVVEHPKPSGKCIECPKLNDCNDESQSTWIFALFETFMFLHFLEKYTEQPCQETEKLLMQLLEEGKVSYDELFTPKEIDNFSDTMRTFLNHKLSKDMHNKKGKSPKIYETAKPENKNFDNCSENLGGQSRSNSDEDISTELESEDFQNSLTSVESSHPPTSSSASNDFQNSSTSIESSHLPTSNGSSNDFQNSSTLTELSKHPPTSNGASTDFQNSLRSTESKHASTLNGASSHFQNPQTLTENTDSATEVVTCEKFVENGLGLMQRSSNDQTRKREMVATKKDKSQLQGGQNSLEVQTYGYNIKASRLTMQNSLRADLNTLRSGKPTEKCKDVLELWEYENQENHLRELIDKICRLEKLIESLKIENQEILADFGQCIVEKAARENEERKSKVLQSIICFKEKPAVAFVDNSTGDIKDFRLGYPKESHVNKIGNPEVHASVVTAPPDKQPVQGAKALVTASINHQRKEIGAQGSSSFASEERASGGEGNNESENDKGSIVLASASEEGMNLSFSVQQDYSNETEYISLNHMPLQSVATLLYTNYKLLLVSQSQLLLSSDVMKLKDWAALNFSIENPQSSTDVLLQLDKKGVINASDLGPLRNFFESIVRFDLVYIIDEFLLGDYTLLHKISVMKKRDATKALQNPQHASRYTRALSSLRQTSLQGSTPARSAASSGSLRMITNENPATLRKPENNNGAQSSLPQQRHQSLFPNTSTLSNANNPKPPSVIPNENQSSVQQQNLKSVTSGFTEQSVVVVNGPIANERRTTAANSSTRKNASVTNSARNTQKIGNDTSKLSKFQPPESSIVSHTHHHGASRDQDLELESNWLCSHYKRHCYVKFECCDKFWPCHRCHNNQSTCGQKKLKSRDTQMVKCVYCKKVQPFGQFCCNCAAKFSSYFCGMCKHLTGNDDHPYHCDKCGICRIHGDRSFHCDVCGVCLDVQLRGNHKCRAGSAHDECCICLEDAFTGCQILPCSHKVHKECATQMIRSGITRCPICRESFAHKLERRPLQSRKRSGK